MNGRFVLSVAALVLVFGLFVSTHLAYAGSGIGIASGPVLTKFTQGTGSCYEVSNFTVSDSKAVYPNNVSINATVLSVGANSSSLLINGVVYLLTTGQDTNILYASGYNYTVSLKSVSYPILLTVTVDICSIPLQAPALTITIVPTSSTVMPANTLQANSASNSTTPLQQSASQSNSPGILLYVAGGALAGVLAVLLYTFVAKRREDRK